MAMWNLIARYWPYGLLVSVLHFVIYGICNFWEWPPKNPLEFLDGPIFQIVNSIVLLCNPPVRWGQPGDFGDFSSGMIRAITTFILLSIQWFLIGIGIRGLLWHRKALPKGHIYRKVASKVLIVIILINGGWYVYVFGNTYWGLISKIGTQHLDCGVIEIVESPDSIPSVSNEASSQYEFALIEAENMRNRSRFLSAYKEHNAAKLQIRYEEVVDYLFMEFKDDLCSIDALWILKCTGQYMFIQFDLRGWDFQRIENRSVAGMEIIEKEFRRHANKIVKEKVLAIHDQEGKIYYF